MSENRKWFKKGILGGIPIGLGYFAVAFAVGITAHDIGMTAIQAFIMSAGMMASAGEYAAPPAQGPKITEICGTTPEAFTLR